MFSITLLTLILCYHFFQPYEVVNVGARAYNNAGKLFPSPRPVVSAGTISLFSIPSTFKSFIRILSNVIFKFRNT